MDEPKKRLRGKQPVDSSKAYDAAETFAPKKRLRGKQKVMTESPKMAKAKARVKKKRIKGPAIHRYPEKSISDRTWAPSTSPSA